MAWNVEDVITKLQAYISTSEKQIPLPEYDSDVHLKIRKMNLDLLGYNQAVQRYYKHTNRKFPHVHARVSTVGHKPIFKTIMVKVTCAYIASSETMD